MEEGGKLQLTCPDSSDDEWVLPGKQKKQRKKNKKDKRRMRMLDDDDCDEAATRGRSPSAPPGAEQDGAASCAFCMGWTGVKRCPFHCAEGLAGMGYVGEFRDGAREWNSIVERMTTVQQQQQQQKGDEEGMEEWRKWFFEGANLSGDDSIFMLR